MTIRARVAATTTQTTAAVETTTTSRSERDRFDVAGARWLCSSSWWRQALACLLVACLACFLVHCSRCERESAPAPAGSAPVVPPPVAPRGLLAELVVPRPDQL